MLPKQQGTEVPSQAHGKLFETGPARGVVKGVCLQTGLRLLPVQKAVSWQRRSLLLCAIIIAGKCFTVACAQYSDN